VEFRILGPLEAWDDGRRLPLGGVKQRALLAALLLHANEVVPGDRLIEELWGEDSSDTAATSLRVSVSRLRKALPPDTLVTRPPGYTIRLGPDQLDLHRFERLVEEARHAAVRGAAAVASDLLGEALAIWRGPALADFPYETFALGAIARLEEIRLAALELRLELDLALGRERELIGELEALVAENPLRERLRGHLMLALYRSGRQAEALRVYQEGRRVLVDGLGIDPSPALQELERAILRQDTALAAPAAPVASDQPERSILVALNGESRLDALLPLAERLARRPPRALILARVVREPAELGPSSAWLHGQGAALEARGVAGRTATFTSASPGEEMARLAAELDVDLVIAEAPVAFLAEGVPDADLSALLAGALCDVAVVVCRDAAPEGAAVLVPFGGADHDWAAVELGAWLARAGDVPLRLAGAAAVPEEGRRDASRLLSHASLAVQRVLGVSAEPLLIPPGETGLLEASEDAGLVVVGLSARWEREGLGAARLHIAREARAPVVLVRKGLRPGGLAPPSTLTSFTWSIRP
jgi:DNA-binding SARP family transcriptional activator